MTLYEIIEKCKNCVGEINNKERGDFSEEHSCPFDCVSNDIYLESGQIVKGMMHTECRRRAGSTYQETVVHFIPITNGIKGETVVNLMAITGIHRYG